MTNPWAQLPKVWEQKPRAIAGEALLMVVLFVAWLVSFIGVDSTLDDLSPAGRALYLVNWFTSDSFGISFLLVTVAIVVMPLRHVSPLGALVGASACITAFHWWYPLIATNSIVQFILLAILTAWTSWKTRQWWWVIPVLAFPIAALSIRVFQVNDRFEAINSSPSTTLLSVSRMVQEILLYGLAIGVGLVVRLLGERSAELEQRNEELEAERANTAAAAVVGERLRISRELHDVVAHHVTTMTVHAGAARQLIGTAPDKATESLLHIESAGRSAVNELHQLLGYLRGESGDGSDTGEPANGDRSPTPSLRHLDQVRESVAGKIECTFAIDGDLGRVPSAVDVSAFRIVQEALTNTMKHSLASTAHVDIKVLKAALELTVSDTGGKRVWASANGASDPGPGEKPGGGHGLVGMRERATLHGGQVEVGPATGPDGGWKVWALLPFGTT